MARKHILVVEDENDIQELIQYNLKKEGYAITGVVTGEQALTTARAAKPELVLLDLMLPGVDGLEVCRRLKGDPSTQHIPIVMLTAKGEESDIVVGLELGADDYITKPFSPKVLLARLRAVLRRRAREEKDDTAVVVQGEITIDPARHEATVKGKRVDLTATEFHVLHFLARKPGWVFTRQQIVDAVKGEDYPVTDRSVDVQMVGLRKKLGSCAKYIETVRGIGYRFKE
ncbi:MAG: response regulator [Kiritimatiellae bacterium]|nr:response regulator [Kiritimatiellia bacterium]